MIDTFCGDDDGVAFDHGIGPDGLIAIALDFKTFKFVTLDDQSAADVVEGEGCFVAIDFHGLEQGALGDEFFAVGNFTGLEEQAITHVLLVAWMDVLGFTDVDGHADAGVGIFDGGEQLGFTQFRPVVLAGLRLLSPEVSQ